MCVGRGGRGRGEGGRGEGGEGGVRGTEDVLWGWNNLCKLTL